MQVGQLGSTHMHKNRSTCKAVRHDQNVLHEETGTWDTKRLALWTVNIWPAVRFGQISRFDPWDEEEDTSNKEDRADAGDSGEAESSVGWQS